MMVLHLPLKARWYDMQESGEMHALLKHPLTLYII